MGVVITETGCARTDYQYLRARQSLMLKQSLFINGRCGKNPPFLEEAVRSYAFLGKGTLGMHRSKRHKPDVGARYQRLCIPTHYQW